MSYLANHRIPLDRALSLSAGTVSWSSLPYFDRLYYLTGARGGTLPPEEETSFDPSYDYDNPTFYSDPHAYDKQVGLYCDALTNQARAYGLVAAYPEVEIPDPEIAALVDA